MSMSLETIPGNSHSRLRSKPTFALRRESALGQTQTVATQTEQILKELSRSLCVSSVSTQNYSTLTQNESRERALVTSSTRCWDSAVVPTVHERR